MKVAEVETLIRSFLHDPLRIAADGSIDYDRWSPAIILSYINLAISDIASKLDINRVEEYLPYPTIDNPYVELPKGTVRDITLDGCSVTGASDCKSTDGIKFSSDKKSFTLYPLGAPMDNLTLKSEDLAYGIFNFGYGAMIDLTAYSNSDSYSVDNPYGASRFSSDINLFKHNLKAVYNRVPQVSNRDSDFPLEDKYALCVKEFVCGHLLRSDRDANSVELGMQELSLYNKCISEAEKLIDAGDTLQITSLEGYEIPYRRGI